MWLLACIALSAPAVEAEREVLLLTVTGVGVNSALPIEVELLLGEEIDERPGYVRRILREGEVAVDEACLAEPECVRELAITTGVHVVVRAEIASLAGTLALSLRAWDGQSGNVLARVGLDVPEQRAERGAVLSRAVVQLLTPEKYVGTLDIASPVVGADVYLDDRWIGRTPLPKPIAGLRAGPHILRLSKAGYSDLYRFVDVVFRQSVRVEVDLANATIEGSIAEQMVTRSGVVLVRADREGLRIRLDGDLRGETPRVHIVSVPTGTHRISVRGDNLPPHDIEVTVGDGERTDVLLSTRGGKIEATVRPRQALDAPEPDVEILTAISAFSSATHAGEQGTPAGAAGWRPPLAVGIVTAGAGAVGIVLGGVFGSMVDKQTRHVADLAAQGENPALTEDQYIELREQHRVAVEHGREVELGQWLGYGLGSVVLAAGAALLGWSLWDELTASADVGPEGASASVGFSW